MAGIAALAAAATLLRLVQPAPEALKPDASIVRLDEIGIYSVGYRRDSGAIHEMPTGWTGHFDTPSGISCLAFGEQQGRGVFLLHCPWRNGTGTTFQEFRFVVPACRRITLRGYTAMRTDIVGKSDGATFRVLVNGRKLVERHQTSDGWEAFHVTLEARPGSTLTLRFETDPGPKRDPSFDYSLWADRTVEFVGYKPPATVRHAPPPLKLELLTSRPGQGVAPLVGYRHKTAVVGDQRSARLTYQGDDGTIQYVWTPGTSDFGELRLHARMRGDTARTVALARSASLDWTSPPKLTATRLRVVGNRAECDKTYTIGGKAVHLRLQARLSGKALLLSVTCDAGVVRSLDAGSWGPVMRRKMIPMPYYGSIAYAVREGLFLNAYLDWTTSSASSHNGMTASYDPLTDGRRNPLRETVVFAPAWLLEEALPNIPNAPSPYRSELAGKLVLDVWGGKYRDIARKLETLHGYGVRRCVVLIHDWQRSGYDNALPMHLPAAADKGGDDDMKMLVATATRLGYRIALHENYVDYYPNYDYYDERDIALAPDGSKVPAWYNPGTRIQSFAVKPNAILRLAATQSPELHRRFGTNACYLDVHSAVPPWFHVDFRADEYGAGMFGTVFATHRALFAYERKTHAGPVFGEGNNHWYWSGMLDGAEAQFGTGWPANSGETAPLIPQFNLLRVHPLQINHGQGYYERWWKDLPWGYAPPLALLDQYRMQEVVYGHAGFLGASTWSNPALAWLEHHLVTPVAARHGVSKVLTISYEKNGKWMDTTAAAQTGSFERIRIAYTNGLTILANNGPTPWRAHGATLPVHGWLAHGAGVTAYTATRDGVICDYAETSQSVFANARPATDWAVGGSLRIRPSVADFRQTGLRRFSVSHKWLVGEDVSRDFAAFVHFSAPDADAFDEKIRFQQDHALAKPTSTWKAGSAIADGPYEITVPDDLTDGTYIWSIGLFRPNESRAALDGPVDASGRVVLGALVVANGGKSLQFDPGVAKRNARRSFPERANVGDRLVTFGTVKTNGSVLIERERHEWVLRPYPRDRVFTVQLNAARFKRPTSVRTESGSIHIHPGSTPNGWWTLPLNGSATYRWHAADL
jgi:hypothetical protein